MKTFLTYFKITALSIITSIYLFQIFLTFKYSGSLGQISKRVSLYESSTGKKYDVELTDEGFECNCHGFAFHGYCKHSKAVLKKVEQTTFDNFVRIL